MGECIVVWMDRCMGKSVDGCIGGWCMGVMEFGCMHGCIGECVDGCMHGWVDV